MSRRRRAIALTALSVLLGALAVSDVAGREAALDRRLGPVVTVVARTDLPAGASVTPRTLAVRRVPARFVPTGAFTRAAQVRGLKAAVAIPAGTDLTTPLLRDPAVTAAAGAQAPGAGTLRAGERVADVVARGDHRLLSAGSRIDLLVTRETADGSGDTTLALQDAEVLAASPAAGGDGDGTARAAQQSAEPQVALSLRVSLREAVALAAAQNFAKELRVLVRTDGDRRRGTEGLRVTDASK